jgi:hypothetical protein
MASALLVSSPTAVRGSFSFTLADILRFRYSSNPLHHISSKVSRIGVHARISNHHPLDELGAAHRMIDVFDAHDPTLSQYTNIRGLSQL